MRIPQGVIDTAKRAGWTGLHAALALVITDLGGVSAWWAAPLALGLSTVEMTITGRMGAQKAQAGTSG